ncbi:hypothetical protein TNCV_659981 [Trichonephila clavipes]|nr:hypothetical protein TNCV_659981 [Trichonephila clavipes]
MTENDAPESTRVNVSAYLLLRLVGYQSSWRSTEDFQYTRPHLLEGRSPCFPRSCTARRLTGSAIWRRGICNDVVWDRPLKFGVKRREEFGRRISFSANVVEVPSAVFESCQNSLSFSR